MVHVRGHYRNGSSVRAHERGGAAPGAHARTAVGGGGLLALLVHALGLGPAPDTVPRPHPTPRTSHGSHAVPG